ncbi:hypothetical protein BHE74_00038637 [Ensete ventricosum]|nr:hypothetical protein BHE74_00038637 [Ensete ventricosum]
MNGVNVEDGTWSGGMKLSLDRGQGHEFLLILHGVKDNGSFEAHAPYLREAFDRGTKATQFTKMKLGSEGLGTGQEDAEASTLEEYVIVLSFECDPRMGERRSIVKGANIIGGGGGPTT